MKTQEQKLNKDQYEDLTNKINKMTPHVTKQQKSVRRITALVGGTGSGKSSLACYLKNIHMAFEKVKGGKYKIQHNDKTGKLPTIGHQKESCTTLPGVYEQNGEGFVDLAGWFDTRLPSQQIVNSISNSMIFAPGKEVKVIIVVDIASLDAQRGGILVQNIDRLIEFFELDFKNIINSVILVVSKVKTSDWEIEHIEDQINQICKLNQNLRYNTKYLLQTLVQKKRICLFPNPNEIKNHIKVIQKELSMIRPTILSHNGCVTLSPKAVHMVRDSLVFLNGELNQFGKGFSKDIQFQTLKSPIKDGKKANVLLAQLKVALKILESEMPHCVSLSQYQSLLDQLTSLLNVSKKIGDDMKKNFNMITFYLKLNKNAKIDNTFLEIIKGKLKEVINKVQIIRDDLVSKEEMKKMQQQYKRQEQQRQKKYKRQLAYLRQQRQERQRECAKELQQQQRIYKQTMKSQPKDRQCIEDQLEEVKVVNKIKKQKETQTYGVTTFLKDVFTIGLWRLF